MAKNKVDEALSVLDRTVAGLGGDDRVGQHQLAAAIADSIDSGHHLLAEAPTGSGKSLAYLAAIVASGVRAVITTATLTLQDQLWRNDIPLLREFSGKRVTSALLKGRSNYLCLARLDGTNTEEALFDERPGPTFADDLIKLQNFAETTDTGDIGDLTDSVAPASWRALTCGPSECPGAKRCAQGVDCFAELARSRAELANIVVVNHALYAAHLATGGRVLPEHDLLVIDEAHAFSQIATNALGADVTPGGLRQLGGRLKRAQAPARHTDTLISAAGRLENVLEGLDGRIDPIPDKLAEVLVSAAEAIALASAGVDANRSALSAQAIKLAGSRLDALRRVQTPSAGEVVWVESGNRPTLRLAPISIGSRLAPLLFSEVPVVMVSATLGPGMRFEPLARQLGLNPEAPARAVGERALARGAIGANIAGANIVDPEIPNPEIMDLSEIEPEYEPEDEDGFTLSKENEVIPDLGYEAMRIESPFDLAQQGMLYVAKHLPDIRDAEWDAAAADELCALVEAAGGRTLVLCTSWRNVRAFSEVLKARTEHAILTQGEDSTALLIEQFVTDETSCLVATRAFWQGLDIPGPACVLVVVDRLPFSRPDDPLEQARREAVIATGGDGFREIDLPATALILAQGTGRLIRSHEDRGVVAVLDRRLAVAGYRSVLLATMPPLTRSVDLKEAQEFLRQATLPPD